MAFATKYKTEIQNWDGDTISAEIQFDGSTATVESFTAIGSNPITIEHQANTNVKESYIIPSKATVSFYVNDEWDCHDLLYVNDREAKLIIKKGSSELFVGWVIAAVNTESYTTGQYQIRVDAIDGLADLKNIPYLNSGALYDSYRLISTIIGDCLEETGHSLRFNENCDIYAASGMTTTPSAISPLEQAYIHTKSYGTSIDSVLSCFDVLENICQAFHLRLYQSDGFESNMVNWVLQKINTIGDTTYFRQFGASGGSSLGANQLTFSQTLSTAPTEPHHLGGPAQISIQQGFKEISVTTDRGLSPSLLSGINFDDNDFPTSSTLTNWGNLSNTKLISSWVDSTITQESIGTDTMLALDDYQRQHGGTLGGDTVSNNGSGNVRITKTSHGVLAGDWVILEEDNGGANSYRGIWRVQGGVTANTFDLTATFDSTATSTRWRTINAIEGVEYSTAIALDANHIAEDATGQFIKFNADYYIEERTPGDTWSFVMAVLVAQVSSTNKKVLGYDGRWRDYVGVSTENDIKPILDVFDEEYNDRQPEPKSGSIEVIGELSSSNNFYSAGESCKFYLGLFGFESSVAGQQLKWNNVSVSMIYADDQVVTTTIDTDFVESKDITFFHADGDGGLNEEFRFVRPITDDSSPKLFINSWQQNGGTADNLQDIIQANLVTAYGANSQIWSGMIKGGIDIKDKIIDPLNLNRSFQIQRISKDLKNNFNSLAMIEIEPSEVYYIELISSSTGDKYHLSTEYGDLTSLFLDTETVYISNIRQKSDGSLIEVGGVARTIDGNSVYSGGRTVIEISDAAWGASPGAGLEVKGVLRKV